MWVALELSREWGKLMHRRRRGCSFGPRRTCILVTNTSRSLSAHRRRVPKRKTLKLSPTGLGLIEKWN
jgi:hypothetical protein